MIDRISPVSFQGLKIEGVVSAKNFKKLGEFTNATENFGFIDDLEKMYNTNMVINGKLDEISFSHEIYGDLTPFGCPKFPVKDFFSKVVDVMESIKKATKKAKTDFKNHFEKNDSIRRGC